MTVITSRRNFLAGLGAAFAAPAIVHAANLDRVRGFILPTLHGDGIADDTRGLQAAIDGQPYFHNGTLWQRAVGDALRLPGSYKVRAPLVLDGVSDLEWIGGHIRCEHDEPGLLIMRNSKNLRFSGTIITRRTTVTAYSGAAIEIRA